MTDVEGGNVDPAFNDVREFYNASPFNMGASAADHAARLAKHDPLQTYPPLVQILQPGMRVLEVGCGVGWLSNSAALHHGCDVVGIDFSTPAVARAREISRELGTKASFEVADLFQWQAPTPFDAVVSVGVLMHTRDCIGALRRLSQDFVKPGGYLFIGLYHSFGRKAFLDHFAKLRAQGLSEDELFREYSHLHPLEDGVLLRSWFRDQVLVPHETQHSLAELAPVLAEESLELVSTSLNRFERFSALEELFSIEREYEALGYERLKAGRYFPGFFVFLARKAP